MGDDSKNTKTQVTLAIISLVGVLGAAVIANLDKIVRSGTSSQGNAKVSPTPLQTPAPYEATLHDAENLADRYINALFVKQDANLALQISSVPFYLENENERNFLFTRDDVQNFYAKFGSRDPSHMPTYSLKGQSVQDFGNSIEGHTFEDVLKRLHMENRDFVVKVTTNKGSLLLLVRHDGSSISIAGWKSMR